MSTFAEKFEDTFRRLLPSPLAIALILTLIAFLLALFLSPLESTGHLDKFLDVLVLWQNGLWQENLLAFTVQMMLILVLGHTLALSKPVTRVIDQLTDRLRNGSQAVVVVALSTMIVALFNWGLGLIFGALFARKVAESAHKRKMKISYPLVGAAGYSGLMVWHGGLSGSAPIKANQEGHIAELVQGGMIVPSRIPLEETLFSSMNLFATVLILLCVAITLWFLSKSVPTSIPKTAFFNVKTTAVVSAPIGAEKLDQRKYMGLFWGVMIISAALYLLYQSSNSTSLLTPNFINFMLLGLAFLAHGSLHNFSNALDEGIKGTAGILIQFPLYFGIMAIVRDTGLIRMMAESLIEVSSGTSFPIITFFSAGVINLFVPSGGGQWAIQGPLLIEASQNLGIPIGKSIMAMSYGDQLTNMLQPFWALPLLGITKLKAREILPYTLILMIVGIGVYTTTLLVF